MVSVVWRRPCLKVSAAVVAEFAWHGLLEELLLSRLLSRLIPSGHGLQSHCVIFWWHSIRLITVLINHRKLFTTCSTTFVVLSQDIAVVDGGACHRPLLDLHRVVIHATIAINGHIFSTFEDVFNLEWLDDLVLIRCNSPSRRLSYSNSLELASTTGGSRGRE